MTEHHNLDIHPIPKDKEPMFINEPWLIDDSIYIETIKDQQEAINPENENDNIRVYIPMDINKVAILRRLNHLIFQYEVASEENEFDFSAAVGKIISQIEIYDQIWYVRHITKNSNQRHSDEAIELVQEFIKVLEGIPDGGADCFPFETIEELRTEYLE